MIFILPMQAYTAIHTVKVSVVFDLPAANNRLYKYSNANIFSYLMYIGTLFPFLNQTNVKNDNTVALLTKVDNRD